MPYKRKGHDCLHAKMSHDNKWEPNRISMIHVYSFIFGGQISIEKFTRPSELSEGWISLSPDPLSAEELFINPMSRPSERNNPRTAIMVGTVESGDGSR